MPTITKTNSKNHDFIELVRQLDAYLTITDGDEHDFYDQFNKIADIKYAIVLYEGDEPIGCGAIKTFEPGVMEVKRMYVSPGHRNKGYASLILSELEKWALELSSTKCILETGKRQIEAVQFYKRCGYKVIPNYGQYADVENSVCYEKVLSIKFYPNESL
ncbi:MAG: GNAT family N-acetyltransferase [Bacteroidota bacterium]